MDAATDWLWYAALYSIDVLATTICHHLEPGNIINGIENVWNPLGPYNRVGASWFVVELHQSAYSSPFFPRAYRHYFIITFAERLQQRGLVPVIVEITWHVAHGYDSGLQIPWLALRITTTQFLLRIGMLRGCPSTYRCHIYVNGAVVQDTWIDFWPGSYAHVQAGPPEQPVDSESEIECPHPISKACCNPSESSRTTMSDSMEGIAEHVDNRKPLTDTLVVYRDTKVPHQAKHLFTPIAATGNNFMHQVIGTWPDLRYAVWDLQEIHFSDEADNVHAYVLISPGDLPGPLHETLPPC